MRISCLPTVDASYPDHVGFGLRMGIVHCDDVWTGKAVNAAEIDFFTNDHRDTPFPHFVRTSVTWASTRGWITASLWIVSGSRSAAAGGRPSGVVVVGGHTRWSWVAAKCRPSG